MHRDLSPARLPVVAEVLEGRRFLSATFFVSPHGNDANAGTDAAHAWRHIQQAFDAATPGSTVNVLAGKYNEKVVDNVSGNATEGFITFQAVGKVTISGLHQTGSNLITINNQNFIRIVGFNLQDDTGVNFGSGIRITGADDNIQLIHNTIHNITGSAASGIAAMGTDPTAGISNLVVDSNQIYKCMPANAETLTLNGNVHDFTVTNNYIHDVNNIGIDFIGGEGISHNAATDFARNGECANNRVTRAHFVGTGRDGAGIFVDGSQNITLERNVSWNNDVGIEVNAVNTGFVASGVVVRDNYVFANYREGISIGASQEMDGTVTGCIVTNNTVYRDNIRHTAGGEIRVQWGSGNVFKNNLVSAAKGTVLLDDELGASNTVSDFNLYFSPDGGANARFIWGGFPYIGLAALQIGSGQDGNSLFANPLLSSPGSGKPRISGRSPAINAGDPSFTPAAGETDLLGQPRLRGGRVDIGAVEAA